MQDFNPSQRLKTISLSEGRTKLGFFLFQKFDGHIEVFNLQPSRFDVSYKENLSLEHLGRAKGVLGQ